MIGRYFEPDEKICLIFCNEHYDKLREIPVFNMRFPDKEMYGPLRNEFLYHDMPHAREWAD